jgi:hypothetical protein
MNTAENAAQAQPTENGQRLATLERGPVEQLRVTWARFKGWPFLSLRVWHCGSDGVWRPDRERGCTVKLRELDAFAQAVQVARELAASDAPDAKAESRRTA